MAVEMAKLSLWLVSMDPGRPFTFLDDKLAVGDSLLGITSIEQLEWMHLNPAEGRKLHEDTLLDFMSGIRGVLADVSEQRRILVDIPDDIDGIAKKRKILSEVRSKTKNLSLYADLLAGAALKTRRWLGAAKLAHDATVDGSIAEAREWLAADQPDGAFDRYPLHWPLVFPEVFDPARPGFDAVIGNPPFLGGQKLTGSLGTAYRKYLVEEIGHGVRGSADLIAYFLLRSHELLNADGQTGLIATNTLTQGDTREVGLDQTVASGTEIRQAIKSKPWPSKSAVLEYAAVWTSRSAIDPLVKRLADGVPVSRIASSLDPASRVAGKPERLAANAGISFQGSTILGLGFTIDPERARELIVREPRNADVLFPYINGQDLSSRPDCSASRWVINFYDWSEEDAKRYHEAYDQVRHHVRPERLKVQFSTHAREHWWQYERRRPELYEAIARLNRVIVLTRHTKTVMPVMVPTGQVMSEATVVFASGDTAMLTLLSSALHHWWTIERASTLETRIRYTPSDVFETFSLPELTPQMRELGDRLDTFRRDLMLSRHAGLTTTYNLVHNPKCADTDIAELRDIHRAIDEAVVRAYGWTDLLESGLDHGFHDTRQGTRYTIGPVVRQEILDRLLELNHARYAAEVKAGLHDKPRKKRTNADPGGLSLF